MRNKMQQGMQKGMENVSEEQCNETIQKVHAIAAQPFMNAADGGDAATLDELKRVCHGLKLQMKECGVKLKRKRTRTSPRSKKGNKKQTEQKRDRIILQKVHQKDQSCTLQLNL